MDQDAIESHIAQHIETHLGPIGTILRSDDVNVFHIPPTTARPLHVLVTSGMSNVAMDLPAEENPELRHAEVVMCLPEYWRMEEKYQADDRHGWPVRVLMEVAKAPATYGAFVVMGTLVPNGEPPEAYASNTGLCGVMAMPLGVLPERFRVLALPDRMINFYSLWPLYPEEIDLVQRDGVDALLEKFQLDDEVGVEEAEVVSIRRKNVLERPKRWGFFG